MKLNHTFVLSGASEVLSGEGWRATYDAIANSVLAMVWPPGSGDFRIPRIRKTVWKRKRVEWRNGVEPIKRMFRKLMREREWICEHPVSLAKYISDGHQLSFNLLRYPQLEIVTDILNQSVGDFDFAITDKTGFRSIVEWETGNISSSHRSLNKMCMALWADLADAAVLIVPSQAMYPHLTDRIGNIRELQPYFFYFSKVAALAPGKILAIFEVEQDELFDASSLDDYINQGKAGNSKKNRIRRTKKA